jgi:hypothetical protein
MGRNSKRRGEKIVGRFLALPYSVLNSGEFRSLSNASVRLLLLIASQYVGGNNGKLVCCTKFLEKHGRASRGSMDRGLKELIAAGLLCRTRIGYRKLASWYAIAWRELDVPVSEHGFRAGEFSRFHPNLKSIDTVTVYQKRGFDTTVVSSESAMTPPRCQKPNESVVC